MLLDAPSLASDQYHAFMLDVFSRAGRHPSNKSRFPRQKSPEPAFKPRRARTVSVSGSGLAAIRVVRCATTRLHYILVPRMRNERSLAPTPSSSDPLRQSDGLSGEESGNTGVTRKIAERQTLADDIIKRNEQLCRSVGQRVSRTSLERGNSYSNIHMGQLRA